MAERDTVDFIQVITVIDQHHGRRRAFKQPILETFGQSLESRLILEAARRIEATGGMQKHRYHECIDLDPLAFGPFDHGRLCCLLQRLLEQPAGTGIECLGPGQRIVQDFVLFLMQAALDQLAKRRRLLACTDYRVAVRRNRVDTGVVCIVGQRNCQLAKREGACLILVLFGLARFFGGVFFRYRHGRNSVEKSRGSA